MTPQHPAAPEGETDASGKVALTEAEREALNVAVDEAETCVCCGDDYGSTHVYAAVERIVAERLRVVEGERDAAHEAGYWVGYREGKDEAETRDLNFDEATARAESAEAAHAALVAGVEALAHTAAQLAAMGPVGDSGDTRWGEGYKRAQEQWETELRALLAGGGA